MTTEEMTEVEAEFHYLMATELAYDLGGSLADIVEETLHRVLSAKVER